MGSHEALVANVGQDAIEEEDTHSQRASVDDEKATHMLGDGLRQLEIFAEHACTRRQRSHAYLVSRWDTWVHEIYFAMSAVS